ncbi:MAG: hypothetical protein JST73_06370 [Actinobacteria bacterium]|nr:hypothetical protein [Actinomycetota bacterium]
MRAGSATSTTGGTSAVPGASSTTVAQASTTSGAPSTSASTPPLQPTGLFLNAHQLSLSGTGTVPSTGHSECRTSPGATCTVRFDGTGSTVSLPARTVDASGDVSWDWSPTGLGLAVGHYGVTVVAERGGHQVTATDAQGLTVVN